MANKLTNASAFRIAAATMAVLMLAAAGFIFLQGGRGADSGNESTAAVAAAQALSASATAAINGDAAAVDRLNVVYEDFRRLREQASSLPGNSADWATFDDNARELVARRDALRSAISARSAVASAATSLVSGADELLGASGATEEILAWQQSAAGLEAAVTAAIRADDPSRAAAELSARVGYLRELADALDGADSGIDVAALSAADREAILAPLLEELATVENAVSAIVSETDALAGAAAAVDAVNAAASSLYTVTVTGAPAGPLPGFLANPLVPVALIVLAALLIAVLFFLHSKSSVFEKTAREQAEQNERNQQAILRLLDELGSLADGDLTVEATVTEDITGAIADSINYAIEKLRELVATIDRTSIMVDSAAKQTENTATHMARAAENQAREINAATESIVSMAGSIEEVSGNAERSSDVARHSVEVAHKGGEAVRRTIDGMNTIRETIQDTSKRIKRLGESSQEIGNIVELINDIAEQTNILALNASIQASMAGEAGRGFAVVADEVQRLAERSTNATKQIEVLVRTIQADTNEAVVSMERSTTDVVGGALLAENAGAALDEIEQVSNQIASLVQNISGSARQQASSAADVTRRTTKLKEIGEQTGRATTATAASISKLSLLASQLRETVAGFTLPSAALEASPIGAVPRPSPATASASPESPPAPAAEEKAAGQG